MSHQLRVAYPLQCSTSTYMLIQEGTPPHLHLRKHPLVRLMSFADKQKVRELVPWRVTTHIKDGEAH